MRKQALVFVLASMFALNAVPTAQARQDRGCTQDSLHGAYGYVFSGSQIGIGPVAAVGLAIFDGAGGVTARDTVSTNGEISRVSGRGKLHRKCQLHGLGGDWGWLWESLF